MSSNYSVCIDTDENIIKFTGEYPVKKCEHKNISVSLERNDILCTDCNTRLNPIFWIESHLKHLNDVTRRNSLLLAELMAIQKRLENKGTYICNHCFETNEVDFKRLVSNKAVDSNLRLIDQEISGFRVHL